MRRRCRGGLLAAAAFVLTGCASAAPGGAPGAAPTAGSPAAGSPASEPPAAGTGEVQVAAASDLRFALDEVLETAAAQHPGLRTSVTYGSSGQFLQQIDNGAPFDLYLSADAAYPRELVAAGLAEQDDLFTYATGRLVVWVPEGSVLDPADGLAVLADPRVRSVAVANPEHAPYGVAAVAAMRAAGVLDAAEPKLVLGENVSQAAEFVRAGQADVGVVALSLVLSDPLREVGSWAEVPPELFPPLEQGGVVLAGAEDPDAARRVRDVLLGEQGRAALDRYGFTLPEG